MRCIAFIFGVFLSAHVAAQTTQPEASESESGPPAPQPQATPKVAVGLLTPIPETGGLPPIYSKLYEMTAEELRHRAAAREYGRQIRQIRHKHFGSLKAEKIRKQGLEQLAEFTDPAAFAPMIKELQQDQDDVRLAMLDHFAKQGDEGQAALAWVVLFDKDAAIRNEALRRMTTPAKQPVLYLVDQALRSPSADAANAAAVLANTLHIVQAIPLLIFAQANVTQTNDEPQGDIAWIAIQTQRAYVAGLQPVVGDNSGGFQPIIGVVSEGSVLRIVDAVVIEYRTVVHSSLVNMTSLDWGQPTEPMGYDLRAWWTWYNDVYLPFKREQAKTAENGGAGQVKSQD